jgi:hypothetical protein
MGISDLTNPRVVVVLTVLSLLIFALCFSIFSRRRQKPSAITEQRPQSNPKPQFTTELEALIAIEANTRQALELLRQQNKKSFWSMLFLFGMFSDD